MTFKTENQLPPIQRSSGIIADQHGALTETAARITIPSTHNFPRLFLRKSNGLSGGFGALMIDREGKAIKIIVAGSNNSAIDITRIISQEVAKRDIERESNIRHAKFSNAS
jgi:hypothetical protein